MKPRPGGCLFTSSAGSCATCSWASRGWISTWTRLRTTRGRGPGLDFDLVVEGDAVAFARHISRKYGGRITVHSHFGTASWELDVRKLPIHGMNGSAPLPPLDFVTARSETYAHPGALPTVARGTLADDLNRRDFTINTLALRLDGPHFGQLLDELGGLEDLKQGRVRVLHPDSYIDDPTRILRAVRYEKRYGFQIPPADLGLIQAASSHLGGLSGERLRHELDLILAEPRSVEMMDRLQELNVLQNIDPLLVWDAEKQMSLEEGKKPEPVAWGEVPDLLHQPRRVALSYLLWLGRHEPEAIQELAERLDFSASLREALLDFSSLWPDLPALVKTRPSAVVARLEGIPPLVVCAASLAAEPPIRAILEKYLAQWRHIHSRTTGDDLLRRGLPPGPAYKTILGRLREARLNGEVQTDEEELALLEELIKNQH